MKLLISLCLAVSLLSHLGTTLTNEQLSAASTLIRNAIDQDAIDRGSPNDRRFFGGFVRLSFHDCVGDRCDGCINQGNPENAGLAVYINALNALFDDNNLANEGWTRADFWAYAGREAVLYSSELSTITTTVPDIRFHYGRQDCSADSTTTEMHEFPSAHGLTQDTVRFFRRQFGFNQRLTTAILGAHTLGAAHRQASGFRFPWVVRKNHFDNQYYVDLMNGGPGGMDFTMQNVARNGEPKWLWQSNTDGPNTMMLNADVSLLKELTGMDADGHVTGCTYSTCNAATLTTDNWVATYASNNEQFIDDFSTAFVIMYEHGYNGEGQPTLTAP